MVPLIRFLFGVCSDVNCKITTTHKTLLAISILIKVSLCCESPCALWAHHCEQNFSNNIHTDRPTVSLWCKVSYALSDVSFQQISSGNIHTDEISLSCVFRCASLWRVFWCVLWNHHCEKNSSGKFHIDKFSYWCALWYALSDGFYKQTLLAIFTLISFLVFVPSNMHCQMAFINKAFLAVFTLIRLLFGVCTHMCPSMTKIDFELWAKTWTKVKIFHFWYILPKYSSYQAQSQ